VLAGKLGILPGERTEILRRGRWDPPSPIDALAIALPLLAATLIATFWQE